MALLALDEPAPPTAALEDGRRFFEAQEVLRDRLLDRLERRHGAAEGDLRRRVHALRRAIRDAAADPTSAREERAMLGEIERLSGFPRDLYGGATITQEEIAECLKRLRACLLTREFIDRMHQVVPVPVAGRTAHVRVPEPLAVRSDADGADRDSGALVVALRARMQMTLDALHAELGPRVDPFCQENPLATRD